MKDEMNAGMLLCETVLVSRFVCATWASSTYSQKLGIRVTSTIPVSFRKSDTMRLSPASRQPIKMVITKGNIQTSHPVRRYWPTITWMLKMKNRWIDHKISERTMTAA
jgi:hypothetical protein